MNVHGSSHPCLSPLVALVYIRSAVQLAPSAFLASAAGCASLTRQILPSHMHSSSYPDVGLALAHWNGDNLSPPSSPNKGKQKAWDLPKVHACFEHLVSTSPSPVSRARLLGAASKESGAWLNAPPSLLPGSPNG